MSPAANPVDFLMGMRRAIGSESGFTMSHGVLMETLVNISYQINTNSGGDSAENESS